MQAKGSNGRIIYQEETTFKTDPTTVSATGVTFVSESIKNTIGLLEDDSLRDNRNSVKPIQDKVTVAGDLTVNLQANNIGSLLKFALGSVTTTGTAPYVHTISVGQTLPSFVLEKGFTDISEYFKYNGCKVNGFSLSLTPTGYQKLVLHIVGAKETLSATSYDAAATTNYVPFDGKNNLVTIQEGGTAIAIVTDLTLDLTNNVKTDNYVLANGGEVNSFPEGLVAVTGTLNAQFTDAALYNKAVAGTESSLFIEFQKGTGDGSAGNEYMSINIPELIFETGTPEISSPDGIVIGLPFRAYYQNSAEATSIQIVIKNEEATI